MDDIKDLRPDLGKLENQLDNLEDTLEPLMGNLQELSSQLPLLEKAKLFALTAYSLESMLFASLKLDGQDAQNHAVFNELKRTQQYFAKIKKAEEPEDQRAQSVNKEAVARILKSDLSDNKDVKTKLAQKIAEERAKALLKSMEPKKRPAEDSPAASGAESSDAKKSKKSKKPRKQKDSATAAGEETGEAGGPRASKKAQRKI